METLSVEMKGAKLQFKLYGQGMPVMLVHGFGEDSSIWEEQVNFLSAKYQVIVPDLPGTGASEILKGAKIGMSDYAAALKGIAEAVTTDPIVMIGHSMGGYITLAFAEKYSDRLRAFGLVHSGAYADDENIKITREKAIHFIGEQGSEAFLRTSTPGLFYQPDLHQVLINRLVSNSGKADPNVLIGYYRAMMTRPDRTEVLKTFPRPVLIVAGEHDKAVAFAHSLEQSYLPETAQLFVLRKSAHMAMAEETAECNSALASFLESL